jgi:hypothetical protein
MSKVKIFNWALNMTGLVCATFVIWQFVDRYYLKNVRLVNRISVGSRVELPGVSWIESPQTVVLALSVYCQYCRASAPFYRSLAEAARSGQFRTLAVLREPSVESAPLLAALGVDGVQDVRYSDLETIGVRATPTLLIVDDKGFVQAALTGKLSEAEEKDVFAKLAIVAPAGRPATAFADESGLRIVEAAELRELLNDPETLLVDSRDRVIFEQAHIAGALNIPLDEILSRAPHELPKEKTIYVYCHFSKACEDSKKAGQEEPQMSLCAVTNTTFGWAAFHKLRYIPHGLSTLAAEGIPIAGTLCR